MENTQANEKYYRQNGDVVQGADIPSIRRQQLKDAIRNNRLGSYNAHGRYTLSPRITKEILSITKYIYKQHYDDVMKESKDVLEFRSTASIPVFGQMEFRIVFKEKIAKLYLIENVYREFNGYQEIYGEQITEINCEDDRDSVVDYVLSLLNVKILDETDEGKIPDEDPEKVKAIIFDKLYLSIVAKNYLKESADEERETFEDIIAKLKDGGEYGKRVLKNFIDRIEKRPDIMQLKDEDGYNEALNDALIGALEVATTEEDLKDPHNKKIYDDIYKRRYKKTEEDLTKAQENVTEKDFKKVADGVLGRDISDKLFGDPAEIASLIGEKREETRQEPQDNSFLEDLLTNPIIKREIDKIAGRTVGQTRQDPTAIDEAAQAAADQEAARRREEAARGRTGQTQGGEEHEDTRGPQGSDKKARAKTDGPFSEFIKNQREKADFNSQTSTDRRESTATQGRGFSSTGTGSTVGGNGPKTGTNIKTDEVHEENNETSNLRKRQYSQTHTDNETQQTSREESSEHHVDETKGTQDSTTARARQQQANESKETQGVHDDQERQTKEGKVEDETIEDELDDEAAVDEEAETAAEKAAREASERAKYEEILRKVAEEAARAAKEKADQAAADAAAEAAREAAAKEAAAKEAAKKTQEQEEEFTISQ